MKIAFNRIFRKNLLFMVLILALFVWIKAQDVDSVRNSSVQAELVEELITQSEGMGDEELEVWLFALDDVWGAYNENDVESAIRALKSSISNRNKVNLLISFARTGGGKLPATLPKDYVDLMDFYAGLEAAEIINQQYLDDYFNLQTHNLVPVFVLCLVVVYWNYHYESEMYRYTKTVKKGERYTKSYRRILLGVSFILLIANELFDLTFSGLLTHPSIWSASMQSYGSFAYTQMDCDILSVFVFMWISKVLGVVLLTMLGERIASSKKNLKDAAMTSFFVLMAFLFLGKALSATGVSSMMQMGYVDWKEVIRSARFFPWIGISSMEAGVAVVAVAIFLVTGIQLRKSESR